MSRMSPPKATVWVASLFVTGLLLGSWTGRAAVGRATDPYDGLERFAVMLTAIEADHVQSKGPDELVDAAIAGMVDVLDPHSRWMSAADVKSLRDDSEGEGTGFGIDVSVDGGAVVIKSVLPGSPAEREGLVKGDRILAIDGEPLAGMDRQSIERRFEGERGEPAKLEVLRDGWDQPIALDTQRDQLHLPATEAALLPGDVMYVRIIDFQRGCAEELAADLERLQKEATRKDVGLLLDLRDNTGGLLSEAVAVVDLFVDEQLVVKVERRRGETEEHFAHVGKQPDYPIWVLVDGLSASASEIVAGALREAGRARLLGTRTYGKGSVQQLYRNKDGSALKLTIAEYRLASGAPIPARQGLEPDVVVTPQRALGAKRLLQDRISTLDVVPGERQALLTLLDGVDDRPARMQRHDWGLPVERRPEDPVVQAAMQQLLRP